ncbi:hypothetical protein FSP39_019020 [Pinctada imbricata]|uniref:Uncharacterized protein n=1 Tax=Pinctada imbricata TaxID=66713 RepID=A0AA88Y090_PINIB|nr:hypothetical protein FSP39_019020 [Pinctada imbricata]
MMDTIYSLTAEEAEDMLAMMEKLKVSEKAEEQNQCLDRILSFLTESQEDEIEGALETSVENGMLSDLFDVMRNTSEDTLCKVVQILAELAKVETVRQPCVDQGFVPILLQLLKSENVALATQACRALGNICFENDGGRNAVDKEDGIHTLLVLLRSRLKSTDTGADRLRTIACGFLLNLTNTHEDLMQKALDDGALDTMNEYLQQHRNDSGLCNMVLLTIGVLTDSEYSKDKLINSSLCTTIIGLFESDSGSIFEETILDLLITLSEWDEVKEVLAETNLSNHLIRVIQSNTGKIDSDSQQTIKMASDLLVLLLTGDRGMEKLFSDGSSPLYLEIVKWLESENSQLQLSSVLSIGNFARNDNHCKKLVEDGIVDILVSLLQTHHDNQDITLQHAILSALRNLAIPVSNKAVLLMSGVMEAVVALTSSDTMAVVFKLLGVLRMLVDGQETAAVQLGSDMRFMDRLAGWCDVDEHAGVQGEATRLLASLIKNSKSSDVMRNVIRSQSIPYLVTMATSEHVVMQNEALVALSILCSTVLSESAVQLKEADLTETVMGILGDEKTAPEIMCNTLTLIRTVCTEGSLREEISSAGILDVIRLLSIEYKDMKVREAAESVLAAIEDIPIER